MAKLFRGPTKGRLFQTTDLGSGTSKKLVEAARKNPKRSYLAIDGKVTKTQLREKYGTLPKNFKFLQMDAIKTLEQMAKHNVKTRHVSIDAPANLLLHLDSVFKNSKKVLLPGGKIYLTTEMHMDELWKEPAKKYGFTVKELPNVKYPKTDYQIRWKQMGIPIRRFEFTLK